MNEVEELTKSLGRELFSLVRKEAHSLVSSYWWKEKTIMWFSRDEELRTQMLRFVDVFPCLRTTAEKRQHIKEYFILGLRHPPFIFRIADSLSQLPLGDVSVASITEKLVKSIGQHFIVRPEPEEILDAIKRLQKKGIGYTLDVLGEAVLSESEADKYMNRYISLAENLPAASSPNLDFSVKLSALYSQFDPIDFEGSLTAVTSRLGRILNAIRNTHASITVDAEQLQYRELTMCAFMEVFSKDEFKDFPSPGIAMHSYFLDSEEKITELVSWVRIHQKPILVRLVKGAYWDWETITANQKGWPVPVYGKKWQTDSCFERATTLLLANSDVIRLAVASHNIRSIAQAMAKASLLGIPRERMEFQVLMGMGDPLGRAIRKMGYPTRIYMASGELLPGIGFLVRRIIENTSQTGFLFQNIGSGLSPEDLLKTPETSL